MHKHSDKPNTFYLYELVWCMLMFNLKLLSARYASHFILSQVLEKSHEYPSMPAVFMCAK